MGTEKKMNRKQGTCGLLKRSFTFLLAFMVMFTSIPIQSVWANDTFYERPGDDEIILDDSIEEGELSDLDVDISHSISKKGDKATIRVSVAPSEAGIENGVTKVTKVEIHENGKNKKGKRVDEDWQFTVKENGTYSFIIYYNSDEGEEILVASPSDAPKVEKETPEAPENPGIGGGAGGSAGTNVPETETPDTIPDENETVEDTEKETVGENTDSEKPESEGNKDNETEGDSEKDTPASGENKPDNTEQENTGDSTGDTTGDTTDKDSGTGNGQGGEDANQGSGSSENTEDNGAAGESDDTGSGSSSGDANSSGDSSSGTSDGGDSSSSGEDSSGSSGDSDSSSGDSGSNSSGSDDSGASGSEEGGSDDSGSSDSIALNIVDFFFPVIEAYAGDFTVKKAVIIEYEINNLYPEGNPDDVEIDIFDELTEQGAMITVLAEPSESGLEQGVVEITDITLIDFEPEEEAEVIEDGGIEIATDSEAEEVVLEDIEELDIASPSNAVHDTTKTASAKRAEYQNAESDEGEYRFFVKENGIYTFSVRYGRAADEEFDDSTELIETQFSTTYELESIMPGVQFTGVEDATIQAGEEFDLLAGVEAVSGTGMELPVVIQDKGGFDPMVPGTYKVTYTVATRAAMEGGNAGRLITVMPRAVGDLSVVSNIHGEEAGKTLTVPISTAVTGIVSVAYDLPVGVKDRVLKIAWPASTNSTYPTDNITSTYYETVDGVRYTCLKINDAATGNMTFDMRYTISYSFNDDKMREEYLLAGGELDIGQIHVIATTGTAASDEAPLAESTIGPFITEKLDKRSEDTAIRYQKRTSYVLAPYSYLMEVDMDDQPLVDNYRLGYSPASLWKADVYVNVANYSRSKPTIIRKVRVYAPTQFGFEIDSYDKAKGVGSGVDEDGAAYMEFPYVDYKSMSGTNSVTELFSRTKLIRQNELTELVPGLHTSKKSVAFCLGYGDTVEEVELNSVLTIDVNKMNFQQADCLEIKDYGYTSSYPLYSPGTEAANEYIVSNSSVLIKNEDGINYWSTPADRENITISVSYPQELQARSFYYWTTGKIDPYIGASSVLEKIVLHLESGDSIELSPGQSNDSSVNPTDSHVDSADYVFKELYGKDVVIQTSFELENIHKPMEVSSTGTIKGKDKNKEAQHVYQIRVKEGLKLRTTFTGMSGSALSHNQIYTGRLDLITDSGAKRITTNPKIVIEDKKILSLFTGSMIVFSLNPLEGGKIKYTTSLNKEGEAEIPGSAIGKVQFVNLEPGERLTSIVITKEGTTDVYSNLSTLMAFEMNYTRAELIEKFQADERTATVEASMKYSSEEFEEAEILTATETIRLYSDVTLKNPIWQRNAIYQVYQGDTYEMPSDNIWIQSDMNVTEKIPMDLTLYLKLENTDKFVFSGGDAGSQFELIDKPDGKYLKIKPNEIFKAKTEYVTGKGYGFYYAIPKLKFMALPGATLGTYPIISDVYVDTSKMLENSEVYKTEYSLIMSYQGLIEDSLDLAGRNDDTPCMWKVDTTKYRQDLEILQQNLATVIVTPGLEEIYSSGEQIFYPTGRMFLNAMAGIGSGSNELNDYKIHIPIPREGVPVSYSYNGVTGEDTSDYDVFLKNEPRLINNGIDCEVSYKLEGEAAYISAAEVGEQWNEVVEVYIEVATLPAKSAMVVYLDLEAEDKANIGLGDKQAYIAAKYEYNHGDALYGPRATYSYQDFQITGRNWIDNNENGKYESGEPLTQDISLSLHQNGRPAPNDSYSFSNVNGNYTMKTYLYENLSLKFDDFGGTTEGIKPTLKKANTNTSTSVFEREGVWTANLPDFFKENQSGYDLGIVKLPILTAKNIQVSYKSEVPANVNVVNQTNAPAVNSKIIYGAAEDPSIASISDVGLIKGLKENSLTTATVSVKNSLGDEVSTSYQIAVSDNKIPSLEIHPWVAIQGDHIPDLWHGIKAEDPEEEYPAWKTFLFGDNKTARSIPAGKKTVTIYKNADYTGEISIADALDTSGLYYVRYSVEDDKENTVERDTTLTVYGKMQGVDVTKHYFETGETITAPDAEFYYLDVNGVQVPVTEGIQTTGGTGGWILNEGPLGSLVQKATHPEINHVTEGVVAGSGREAIANVRGLVDSKIIPDNPMPEEYVCVPNEWVGKIGWSHGMEDFYRHWTGNNQKEEVRNNFERWTGKDGIMEPGSGTNVDTSVPSVHEYTRTEKVKEDYDNVDEEGNRLRNTFSETIKIIVVGKPVISAPATIYVTPDEVNQEQTVKDKIAATAVYHDGTNPSADVPGNQIKYQFNKTAGKINSVDITAWGGREDNLSDSVRVNVVVRETPVLTLPDIHLRKGTSYGPENFVNRVITPDDEHNEYTYTGNDLATDNLGKYEAEYQVSDTRTGFTDSQFQTIFVHDIPEIIATDKSLYVHQSTGEQALIDAVKAGAKATVEYTKADGTTELKTIPGNELQYQVAPDYVSGKAGRFKVTITADDSAYVPAGLEPIQVTKDVYVDVADQIFHVTFTTNNDNFHDRGTIDGESGLVLKRTIYGQTAEIPVPEANDGYHFDGFKTLKSMTATQSLTLADGTVIAAGAEIPTGTMLSVEQVKTIEIYGNVGFQAYFSASPILNGTDIKLYVGETYNQADLGITVSDLDGDAQGIVIDDSHVDTSKAGTYQIKVSVADGDGNHTEKYVYVQVYGKTVLEGYDPIHIRKGQDISEEQLKNTIKATYAAPPAIPDAPWSVNNQAAIQTETSFSLTGTVNTQVIGMTDLTVQTDGQIEGREADGQDRAMRKVYVHGNPVITATDGALFTHQSTGESVLIDLIKTSAQATIQYVNADGTIKNVSVTAEDLQYEIKAEENYETRKEGTYNVTISLNDAVYVPTGLQPVDVSLQAAVAVSNKTYDVKFSINNDASHHKGDFEGGGSEFSTKAVHGSPAARIPILEAAEGYHFDGFKTLKVFSTTDNLTLSDGTVIVAGTDIPVGTLLTEEQVSTIKIYDNVEFQAYFSATPVIKGNNIVLYEKEEYKQQKLNVEVSDADQNATTPVIDDVHVDTDVPGTYQVKITISDADGNTAEKYLYVQVVGKTYFTTAPDLHTRKGQVITAIQLTDGVKAVYKKPLDIPEEPWLDSNKNNNGKPAVLTDVEVRTTDTVDTDTIRKTAATFKASGMIQGREMTGGATVVRDVYIHGNPVVVAYDNGLYTHQSTGTGVLEQVVRTGQGTMSRAAASAYVEYVLSDGTIKKVDIASGKISYGVDQYVPLTAGEYSVKATVDDSSVLNQSQAATLEAAIGEKAVKITVADKLYNVMFEMGEHGGLENPADSVTTVAHGKSPVSPVLAPEEGYELDYWTDESGNRVNLASVVITADRKFTAQFKIKVFTVRFIGKRDRVIKTELVKYGHDATPPTEDRDVTNKRFDGWSASYYNIKSDMDIYTTYWKSTPGGPSGGGGFVPTGPGIEIHGPEVPKGLPDLIAIGSNPVPTGNITPPIVIDPNASIDEIMLLPKTGDTTNGKHSWLSYDVRELEEGEVQLDGGVPSQSETGLAVAAAVVDKGRRCILHIILLGVALLEGIYYWFKKRRDKKDLKKLDEELSGLKEKEEE